METPPLRAMWFVTPALSAIATAMAASQQSTLIAVRNTSSDAQYDALVAGDVDVVVTAMDNVLAWNQRPGPRDFCIVAQIEATTPLTLVAQPGIRQLSDLAGANILVDSPDNGFVIALRAMLKENGLADSSYLLTPAGGVKERFDALSNREGEATLLGPPFDALAIAKGMSAVASIQRHYPVFPGQGVVMRRANKGARQNVSGWLRELEQARTAVSQNTGWAREVLTVAGLPEAAVQAMLDTTPTTLRPDEAGIALLIEHRKSLGLPGSFASYESIVDASLLPNHLQDNV